MSAVATPENIDAQEKSHILGLHFMAFSWLFQAGV